MRKILAGLLAISSAAAQPTGDWGRAAMMDNGMGGYGSPVHTILWTAFSIGLVLLVWLWVFKLWKEVRRMK
jgi:hypothetical protein